MGSVGIVANPQSGKDVRRLSSAAGQVSDGVKVDTVRQVTLAALEGGADLVLLAADRSNIAARAINGIGDRVELVEGPATGSRLDSIDAAEQMRKRDVTVTIGLGGDGTCRDLATGWPSMPLIAMSTGTNNAYPKMLNPTAAGLAAGHLAAGSVAVADVASDSKRIVIDDGDREHYALVDVALIQTNAVGARAVTDSASVRWVLACLAQPTSTGLSSVVARNQLVGPDDDGAVMVMLASADDGNAGEPVRAPLSPGEFSTVWVTDTQHVPEGDSVELSGTGVLAFDGERECLFREGTVAHVDRLGPQVIDVGATLQRALDPEGR